jgi:hypothetical protein
VTEPDCIGPVSYLQTAHDRLNLGTPGNQGRLFLRRLPAHDEHEHAQQRDAQAE